MSLSKLVELVGKAEEEGVTLAAMISRGLSAGELEAARQELSVEISKSRMATDDYMRDVEVPSLEDIMATGFHGFPSLEPDELEPIEEPTASH